MDAMQWSVTRSHEIRELARLRLKNVMAVEFWVALVLTKRAKLMAADSIRVPINQFWSIHLTFPVLGSGAGNQPFKTIKDYNDFLKRINDFTAYIDTSHQPRERPRHRGAACRL